MHEGCHIIEVNSLNFPDPECCANSQKNFHNPRERKPAGDLQTFTFLMRLYGLEEKKGHSCISVHLPVLIMDIVTPGLSGSKLVLKQLEEFFHRLSMRVV